MSFGFTLKCRDEGDCATIYSFQKEGEERTEIEKFWDKPSVQDAPDHDALRTRLYGEKPGQSLLETEWWRSESLPSGESLRHDDFSWFRDESKSTNSSAPYLEAVWAPIPNDKLEDLPDPPPSLRLYFFQVIWPRWEWRGRRPEGTQIFVMGNGGVKDVDSVEKVGRQTDENVKRMRQAKRDVRYVMQRVQKRIEQERTLEVIEGGYLLDGKLEFKKQELL